MRALAFLLLLRLRTWFADRAARITDTSEFELDTRLDRRED